MTTSRDTPILPSRDELNISARTAEILGVIDDCEDGDIVASALEAAVLALVDISGDDPNRPAIAQAPKLARRSLTRVLEILESEE